jgi:diguanylate cyclase (GGDEF)-like protein
VRSNRRDYGRLLAMSNDGRRFFPQERELLEVYANYAASALDGATALLEAQERYSHSSALLELARELSVAGTTGEVARRLADAVPLVVDCDRVGVNLWNPALGELVRRAVSYREGIAGPLETEAWSRAPSPGGPLERLLNDPTSDPMFVDTDTGDPLLSELFADVGAVATILVPLAVPDSFLGLLSVSVMDGPKRLVPSPDLMDRLSGVTAQATTALLNGRLLDQITHQALHDELTGLSNRLHFMDQLRAAVNRVRLHAEVVTLLYLDLDGFKPVNDTFGHDVGDQLLAGVAQRLASCSRAADTVARLGGDEFAVLIDAHAADLDTRRIARRITAALKRPFAIKGYDIEVHASIGKASFPADADTADDLLRLADEAMFAAKRRRRERSPWERQSG